MAEAATTSPPAAHPEVKRSRTLSTSSQGGPRIVVVAVDRSQQAEQALEWYLSTVHRPENQLVLVHVPEGPTLKMASGQHLSEGEVQKLVELEKQENAEMTTKFKGLLEKYGVKGEYRVVYSSKPGEAIVEASKTERATMVIMGTRGMGSIRRTIMGSVSDYVVHHSDVPVIICRK